MAKSLRQKVDDPQDRADLEFEERTLKERARDVNGRPTALQERVDRIKVIAGRLDEVAASDEVPEFFQGQVPKTTWLSVRNRYSVVADAYRELLDDTDVKAALATLSSRTETGLP